MMNYLLTSTFIHAGILLSLCYTPVSVNTSGGDRVEVKIVEKTKKLDQAPILPTSRKPLIPGPGAGKAEKHEQVDLTDYANQLKAAVDPVWYSHVHGLEGKLSQRLTTIVLLFPDMYGKVVSIRIVKSSGNKSLDALAIQTFREVGQLPKPPESLVKEGIEWEFTIGGRSQ